MEPIEVIKQLVKDNPNNMQLGELVREYIRELDESMTCQYSGLPSLESYKKWPGLDAVLNGAKVDE